MTESGQCEVNVFEDARRVARRFGALARKQMTGRTDKNRLTRQDIPNNFEAERRDGYTFTGHDVFGLTLGFALPVYEGTDAVGITGRPADRSQR